jgi:hypothetical protein
VNHPNIDWELGLALYFGYYKLGFYAEYSNFSRGIVSVHHVQLVPYLFYKEGILDPRKKTEVTSKKTY